jgi:hypothetical protein
VKAFLCILILTLAAPAFARKVSPSEADCAFNLDGDEALRKLHAQLRRPDGMARDAIAAIIAYLKSIPGDGKAKFKMWQELTHAFNYRRMNDQWINAPSMTTEDGDIVCKGEVRGHLLVFRPDGSIFKSFNPNRPTPFAGYRVDWSDPSWR